MATGQGTAILDFGSFPGLNQASVAVTGQATILANSKVEAYVMANDIVGNHTENDHRYFAMLAGLSCGDLVAATGFTIHARCAEKLTGQFSVRFVWAD